MTEHEKLTELISPFLPESSKVLCIDIAVTHLLASGVVIVPCSVGDTIYKIIETNETIVPIEVAEICCDQYGWTVKNGEENEWTEYCNFEDFGKTVFYTREEAQNALNLRIKERTR